MKEIKIQGLTPRQVELLDFMWNMESKEDLHEWMDTLDAEEIKEVLILKELLLAHCFDEVTETNLAKDYLDKFRL